jgi:hypothetical protein
MKSEKTHRANDLPLLPLAGFDPQLRNMPEPLEALGLRIVGEVSSLVLVQPKLLPPFERLLKSFCRLVDVALGRAEVLLKDEEGGKVGALLRRQLGGGGRREKRDRPHSRVTGGFDEGRHAGVELRERVVSSKSRPLRRHPEAIKR